MIRDYITNINKIQEENEKKTDEANGYQYYLTTVGIKYEKVSIFLKIP